MAKSKRKKATSGEGKAIERKFLKVTLIITIVLIALLYLGYRSTL